MSEIKWEGFNELTKLYFGNFKLVRSIERQVKKDMPKFWSAVHKSAKQHILSKSDNEGNNWCEFKLSEGANITLYSANYIPCSDDSIVIQLKVTDKNLKESIKQKKKDLTNKGYVVKTNEVRKELLPFYSKEEPVNIAIQEIKKIYELYKELVK